MPSNTMPIHFTGSIVGGPHDGGELVLTFGSDTNADDMFERMANVKFDGHIYKISEYNKYTKHAVIIW